MTDQQLDVDQRIVTGVDHAFVNHPNGQAHPVWEGEPIPKGVTDEEIARLEKLGVFGTHPRDVYAAVVAELRGRNPHGPIPDGRIAADLQARMRSTS